MTTKKEILYICMPAYNEEANIEEVVEGWYPILKGKSEKSRLVIADSGSKDKTHQILIDLKKKYPKLEILAKTNQYHGPKCIALYKHAIKKKADWIFQTDSDGQTNPKEFPKFWTERNKYDAIIGKRLERGDGESRKNVEKVLCTLLKFYFKVTLPDANAPFRLMRTDLVAKHISRLPDDYNLPNAMLTTYFVYFKEKVKFISITFKPRQGGVNSIDLKKIVGIGWGALKDFQTLSQALKSHSE